MLPSGPHKPMHSNMYKYAFTHECVHIHAHACTQTHTELHGIYNKQDTKVSLTSFW